MEEQKQTKLARREILQALLAMPPALLLAACGAAQEAAVTTPAVQPTSQPATPLPPPPTQPAPTNIPVSTAPAHTPTPTPTEIVQALPPTPACGDDDDDLTPAQTEGPYYTPNTPERTSFLEPDLVGSKLLVTGQVLSTGCQPIGQALIDFWHCDDAGVYDNAGYRLRGHQFTDDQGRYYLETILPGVYPGRTRHIHVKVQAPHQPVLTTQLYFPGEPGNTGDGIFQPELLVEMQDVADGKSTTFNFVLDIS